MDTSEVLLQHEDDSSAPLEGEGGEGEMVEVAAEQSFQHVELHIVETDAEATELRNKLLAAPDQNVHLLACARELTVPGIVPTQMDAMAGNTPLYTYVLSTDFMGAAQEIARSLIAEVEPTSPPPEGADGEAPPLDVPPAPMVTRRMSRRTGQGLVTDHSSAKEGRDVYEFQENRPESPPAPPKKLRPRMLASRKRKGAPGTAGPGLSEEESAAKRAKKKQLPPEVKCLYCEYASNKKYLLIRHMRCHSDERPHMCPLEKCGRGFKTASSLQNHVNTHSGVKPHICKFEGCGAGFTTSGELVRHTRYKHTHEKPHKCDHPDCGYESVELSKLKRHLRSHTGERPFKCNHCDYASPDTYKLKRHLRVHTGEKPYICSICQQGFSQSNSMKAHRLTHLAKKHKFECHLCAVQCARRSDLKQHIHKLHTSEEPVVCHKCMKSFPDRALYNAHKKDGGCGPSGGAGSRPKIVRVGGPGAGRRTGRGRVRKEAENAENLDGQPDAPSPEGEALLAGSSASVEMGGGMQTIRCILPDGDVLDIISTGMGLGAGSGAQGGSGQPRILTLHATPLTFGSLSPAVPAVQSPSEMEPTAEAPPADSVTEAAGDSEPAVECPEKDDLNQPPTSGDHSPRPEQEATLEHVDIERALL